MKKLQSIAIVALMATVMATTLCGCPQSGNLTCEQLTFDPATGQVYDSKIVPFNGYNEGPFGVYLRFTGKSKGDAIKGGSVTYTLSSGREETIPLTITDGEKSLEGEKCLSCVPPALVGASAIVGFVIPVIINISGSDEAPVSDVIVQAGANTVEYTVRVRLESGAEWFTTFTGLANGYQPPAENDYRLTIKVQGQGSVAIDGVDQEVTTSAVFDVKAGANVHFKAHPASGWRLEKWLVTGDGGETWHDDWTEAEAMVTMDSAVEVIAVFVEESAPADTTAPVITLNGSSQVNLTVGQSWSDPGATATDAVDGVCNVSVSGTVNTAAAGTYVLTYSAADRSGNQASATRTVVVRNADIPEPGTTPKMVYTLLSNGSLQQKFEQDGCTLQQCWLGFPVGKSWSDVDVMGTMFMVGNNPLLFVETTTNGQTTVTLANGSFTPGFSARAVPYIKMKGDGTRLYGNTGIVAGYLGSTKLTRSDGDNYDMSL